MKKLKRFVAITLSALLLMGNMTVSGFAASDSSGSGNKYVIISNESIDPNTEETTGDISASVSNNINPKISQSGDESYMIDKVIPFEFKKTKDAIQGYENYIEGEENLDDTPYIVGDTTTFNTFNLITNKKEVIDATLFYSGTSCDVWVNNDEITKEDARKLGTEFDNNIHSKVTENFGEESDVDGNGKVDIFCYDIVDGYSGSGPYYGGYFAPRDLYPKNMIADSNECEIFYVDTYPSMGTVKGQPDVEKAYTTLAHEFQHMINYNMNVFNEGHIKYMDLWIDEGMSMASEEIYGGKPLQDRIDYYNRSTSITNGHSLLNWDSNGDTLSNYSLSYLFMEYFKIQCGQGDKIFKELNTQKNNDYRDLEILIQKYVDPDMTFGQFMTSFRKALLLKESTGLYGFQGEEAYNALNVKLYTGGTTNLRGGGALVKSVDADFTAPSNKGDNMVYAMLSDISGATVNGIEDKEFQGKPVTLKLEVCDGSKVLTPDKDYTLTYKNNDKVGTASVTVKGCGDYYGSVTKTFNVVSAGTEIYTKADLNNIRNNLSGKYILMNDIEFTAEDFQEGGDFYNEGQGWNPIGDSAAAFTGSFNGNGHIIKNLTVKTKGKYAGLFGYVSGGKISNLKMEASYIQVVPTVNETSYAGGIVGYMDGGSITNCTNTGYVYGCSSGAEAGGIAGEVNNVQIKSCLNTGTVLAESNNFSYEVSGGIVAFVKSGTTIENCENRGYIASTSVLGGIAGYFHSSDISMNNCVNRGHIDSKQTKNVIGNGKAGGVMGYGYGSITNCTNTGNVSGGEFVDKGGIIAQNYSSGSITNCYFLSSVCESAYCYNFGTVNNVKGFSDEEFRDKSNFTGFDFDTVWIIDSTSSYPYPALQGLEGTAKKISIEDANLSFIKEFTYTGSEIKPDVTVTLDGKTLVEDTDYIIEISSNVNVGYGIIKVTGKGNYNYSTSSEFKINPASMNSDISCDNVSCVYDGKAHTISVNAPSDATVNYSNNPDGPFDLSEPPTYTKAGIYKVYYMVSKENYKSVQGKATVTVRRAPLTVTVQNVERAYGVSNPSFSVKINGFVNGEDKSVLNGRLAFQCIATRNSPAGYYDVTTEGYSADNYNIEYVKGTLVILPKQPVITLNLDVSSTTASSNYRRLHVSWTKIPGVTYEYRYKKSGGLYTSWKATSLTSLDISSGISAGTLYYVQVRSVLKTGSKTYRSSSTWKSVYTLKNTSISLYKSGTTSIQVKWTNISGESGYQVYRKAGSKGTWYKVKTLSYKYSSWIDTKRTKGTTYYYKVRPYKMVSIGGKSYYAYAPWSTIKYLKR